MTGIDKDRLSADPAALAEFNRRMIAEFRSNRGQVDGLPGGTLLILHTTGARSGEPRVSPLAFLTVDGRMLIVGSALGSPKAPAWVHNLRARTRVRIEVGTDSYEVTARELVAEERAEVFPHVVEQAPVLAEYQSATDRVIPIFELAPADDRSG